MRNKMSQSATKRQKAQENPTKRHKALQSATERQIFEASCSFQLDLYKCCCDGDRQTEIAWFDNSVHTSISSIDRWKEVNR